MLQVVQPELVASGLAGRRQWRGDGYSLADHLIRGLVEMLADVELVAHGLGVRGVFACTDEVQLPRGSSKNPRRPRSPRLKGMADRSSHHTI